MLIFWGVMVVPTAFFPHFGLPFSEAQGLLEVLDDDLAFLLGWVGGVRYRGHQWFGTTQVAP